MYGTRQTGSQPQDQYVLGTVIGAMPKEPIDPIELVDEPDVDGGPASTLDAPSGRIANHAKAPLRINRFTSASTDAAMPNVSSANVS